MCKNTATLREGKEKGTGVVGEVQENSLVEVTERWENPEGQTRLKIVAKTSPGTAVAQPMNPGWASEIAGDGTVLRLQPQLGFAHQAGVAEIYSAHILLEGAGITDLAGNNLEIFDDIGNPQQAWSVDFQLDAGANSNLIGWHSYLFNAEDEDGTLPGSVDLFGQYRLENGRLTGASGVRFQRSANNNNLAAVSRINRGECWDSGEPEGPNNPAGVSTNNNVAPAYVYPGSEATQNTLVLPAPGFGCVPLDTQGAPHPGLLYWEPRMSDEVPIPALPQVYPGTQPEPSGRVIEPMKPQGSRMQMRYIEDDFTLSYTQPSDFGLDVEQLYWSPFNDETVLYDGYSLANWVLGTRGLRIPGSSCRMCQSLESW